MQTINVTVTNSAAAPVDKISGATLPNQRSYLIIHNPSSTASIAVTCDGTTPAVNTNGITLLPGGTLTSDQYEFPGALSLISSAASSSATILWR